MNIMKHINVPVMIVSFLIGLAAMYLFMPEDRKIIVYPTHENAEILQYKDKANNCFSIKEQNVTCPKDSSQISEIPVQS
tara:strand:- start:594 stop:830 length:237 start_codon:yes stop_codon:yes gene_type:complete